MNDKPEVSIVIVSYNTREMTCACIKSVIDEARGIRQQIIVLDNCSADGSADAIAERFPSVQLIRSADNLGFAKGNNVAAKHATGEYILLLNPDTVILDGAIAKLLQFAKARPAAKMWGGKTLFGDHSLNPGSCWAFMSLWNLTTSAIGLHLVFPGSALTNGEAYGGWSRDNEREVDLITGCFLLMKRDFWEELKGFDDTFYIYAEEADLCYRARQLGARPTVTPTATIIHYGGASESVRSGKLIRLNKGKATFLLKHWPRWKARLGVVILQSHALIRWWGYALSASLRKKAGHEQAAAEWREVWQQRGSWQNGYA